ncbi:MAG: single-stranded-DNA-specific exonuclease RecJ, partial [Chloroflexota bacterium]
AHPLDPETIAAARARGLNGRIARILSRRGPVTEATLAACFDDPRAALHDPALLPDADACRARVDRAVAEGARVCVVGDFDADGLTGLAILVLALRARGLDVLPWIPLREEDGHGIPRRAVDDAAAGGCTLLVSADTGSTSHAEIAYASGLGIDTIVTDHHALPADLPPAVALVNPHRPGSRYPYPDLSGSGVAFKVAQLLLADAEGGPERALALADLAASGTIADLVRPDGENRAICRLGLERIAQDPRPGIRALLAQAPGGERGGRETVSHVLAPRINAPGRVGGAELALDLLLAEDAESAARIAETIEEKNRIRRRQTETAIADARARIAEDAEDGDAGVLVVAGLWPVGVIGLVAGRRAEETGRPALVVSTMAEPWRGSARSPGGYDLAAAFAACDALLVRHGGHAGAAGCQVEPSRFAELRTALAAQLPPTAAGSRPRDLALDLVVGGDAVDSVLLGDLAPLEPAGDPPALLGIAELVVRRIRPVKGGHVQLTFSRASGVIDAIAFGRSDLPEMLAEGMAVDVAGRVGRRTWEGIEQLRIEVRDIAPAGTLRGMRAAAGSAERGVAGAPDAAEAA